jgi:hypothetical protein
MRWIVLLASLLVVLTASSVGMTAGSFVDLESSSGDSFGAWISTLWTQTSQADFDAGVLYKVDTLSIPGDVKLSGSVTDSFDDATKIASMSDLVVDEGQVKLATEGTLSGNLISTNLLGETVGAIDSFSYNASDIPLGTTSLQVQFSQNNTNWYNSAGAEGGWDNLSQGIHSISLSLLGWSGAIFYYKASFASDGTPTPLLDEISVNYFYSTYSTSGTIASQVLDTGVAGSGWDALLWDETLESNTDITFEVRASDTIFLKDADTPSWTSVGGTSPVTSGLLSGRYMQWRATLTTTDTSKTPYLQEVRVYYH